MDNQNKSPALTADVPIPQIDVPHVDIPHMGTQTDTSKAPSPTPSNIDQTTIDAAIAHVQKTGNTDGIPADVLVAACAQIEAQAVAQGIDLKAVAQDQVQTAPAAPSSIEAAVVDKKGAFEAFDTQRDTLKKSVSEQRDALQKPFVEAMNKTSGTSPTVDSRTLKELASNLNDLDPKTMALINAMSLISNHPDLLNGIVCLEVIRVIRQWIANEVKHHVQAHLQNTPPQEAKNNT